MNAGELKELLKDVSDDVPVIMSRDAEGNAYRALAEVDPEGYIWQDGWEFEVVHPDDVDPDDDYGRAIVLWPV